MTNIQWQNSYLEARETDLNADDVDESELWDISYFEDFRIRLVNGREKAEVIDMGEWMEGDRKKQSS